MRKNKCPGKLITSGESEYWRGKKIVFRKSKTLCCGMRETSSSGRLLTSLLLQCKAASARPLFPPPALNVSCSVLYISTKKTGKTQQRACVCSHRYLNCMRVKAKNVIVRSSFHQKVHTSPFYSQSVVQSAFFLGEAAIFRYVHICQRII